VFRVPYIVRLAMEMCHVPYRVRLSKDVFRGVYSGVPGNGCVICAIQCETHYGCVTCHIVWNAYECVMCNIV
jgi:hypothetical protein